MALHSQLCLLFSLLKRLNKGIMLLFKILSQGIFVSALLLSFPRNKLNMFFPSKSHNRIFMSAFPSAQKDSIQARSTLPKHKNPLKSFHVSASLPSFPHNKLNMFCLSKVAPTSSPVCGSLCLKEVNTGSIYSVYIQKESLEQLMSLRLFRALFKISSIYFVSPKSLLTSSHVCCSLCRLCLYTKKSITTTTCLCDFAGLSLAQKKCLMYPCVEISPRGSDTFEFKYLKWKIHINGEEAFDVCLSQNPKKEDGCESARAARAGGSQFFLLTRKLQNFMCGGSLPGEQTNLNFKYLRAKRCQKYPNKKIMCASLKTTARPTDVRTSLIILLKKYSKAIMCGGF
jgi:hypothetical protein